MYTVSKYVLTQRFKGIKRYPLVLMLEPLFRCNLACAGCGKIQYPDHILDKRLTPEQCWAAADECGAPIISIPGGEPLIHPEMPQIVRGLVERKKYVYLCTNAILMERKLDDYSPSQFLTFSVHMDGLKEEHDWAVCRDGVYDVAVKAIKTALARGHRVTTNTTLFDDANPERVRAFFDAMMDLGVEGMMISPGYARWSSTCARARASSRASPTSSTTCPPCRRSRPRASPSPSCTASRSPRSRAGRPPVRSPSVPPGPAPSRRSPRRATGPPRRRSCSIA
jgi:hopanoid biosynthesis associated radical SAM protein HpnH